MKLSELMAGITPSASYAGPAQTDDFVLPLTPSSTLRLQTRPISAPGSLRQRPQTSVHSTFPETGSTEMRSRTLSAGTRSSSGSARL